MKPQNLSPIYHELWPFVWEKPHSQLVKTRLWLQTSLCLEVMFPRSIQRRNSKNFLVTSTKERFVKSADIEGRRRRRRPQDYQKLLIITGDTDDWTARELNFEKFFLHQRKKWQQVGTSHQLAPQFAAHPSAYCLPPLLPNPLLHSQPGLRHPSPSAAHPCSPTLPWWRWSRS